MSWQSQTRPERAADLLTVDFIALDAAGLPVTDLDATEITLRVGGRRRIIRSLQLITSRGDDSASSASTQLPPPFGTNNESDAGRRYSVIVDDDSFKAGREAPLRDAVAGFLDRLSSRDQVSLVTMPYGGVKVPFTNDHGRIRSALARIVGQASGSETGSDLACRSGRTLESLIGYLDAQGIRETPLTVVFITGGLAAPRRDAPVMMPPGRCELRTELYRHVGEAAGAARANFYVIQPTDMMVKGELRTENIAGVGFLGSDNPLEGIEHLAGVTGGRMLNLTGTADGALGRVLRETSAFYRVAFEADRSDRSGRSQEMQVRVSRSGIEVRSRAAVTFARPDTVFRTPQNPSVRDMLAVATVFRDLPLRAVAYTALGAEPGTLRVVTVAEPSDPGTMLSTLVAALFDADGKAVSQWSATADELGRSPVIGAMPAEPGAYRLRVAAIDTNGRAGTADYEIDAEVVQTGALRLSSIVLGLSRDGRFIPRLQFGSEPVAIAYIELDGAPAGTPISASVEIARTVNGPPVGTLPLFIEPRSEGRYVARGALPIAALEPGDYVVRAIIGVQGHPPTRVVRTLRKTGSIGG